MKSDIIFSLFPNHKADAFSPPDHSYISPLDYFLQLIFDGFHKWDAIYYHFISINGYIFENTLAFFPLLPLTLGIISKITYAFPSLWSLWVHNILIGVFWSFLCHVLGAIQMYRLSKLMLMSESISVMSALLYTINPASIFFSTLYSESFYGLLLISALVCLAESHYIQGCFLLSLTTACRSNGIVNCGFGCFPHFIFLVNELSNIYRKKFSIFFAFIKVLEAVSYRILIFFSIIGSSLLPYLIYQYYAGYLYCFTGPKPSYLSFLIPEYPSQELVDYAEELGVLTPYTVNATMHAVWCQGVPWSSYSIIQKYFWNVGAFKYYQLKQLPNFLLALPVLTLVYKTISLFAKRAPKTLFSMGILAETSKQRLLLPHIYHIIFLSTYGIVNVHIQVLTRMMFSSCPVLYWYCASVLLEEDYIFTRVSRNTKSKSKRAIQIHGLDDMHHAVSPSTYPPWSSKRILLYYFYSYIIIGCAMHSNFLPWT
ncbi:unnamed protein product [Rodentolepis nana]|uniref:GPI mannosyltransferase 2 n=1 Tax=Rodentolepis nana TaxID=102285 RepID=A0A0R3T2K0_RODNA|nr:unnamed protein product [Rodentolepis nana]